MDKVGKERLALEDTVKRQDQTIARQNEKIENLLTMANKQENKIEDLQRVLDKTELLAQSKAEMRLGSGETVWLLKTSRFDRVFLLHLLLRATGKCFKLESRRDFFLLTI